MASENVTVEWLDEHQGIVLFTLRDHWQIHEVYEMLETFYVMASENSKRIDSILDMTNSAHIPTTVLSHMRSIAEKQPDNLYLTVVITNNTFTKLIIQTASRISTKVAATYRFADDYDAAIDLIMSVRIKQSS